MAGRRDFDQETGLEKIAGVVALFFWSLLLIEGLGLVVLVGVADFAPRSAALLLLLPALAVWIGASTIRAARRTALAFFTWT